MNRGVLTVVLSVVCATPLAASGIRLELLPDGSRFLFNESPAQQARRWAAVLVPPPTTELAHLIDQEADASGLDARLLRAVVQTESGYNPFAVSTKGAMGLMQLMPETAELLEVLDPFDPRENLRGGTRYLKSLLGHFAGRLEVALAGYNAGPQAVERFGGIPPYPETRAYVDQILRLYRGTGSSPPAASPRPGRPTFVVRTPDRGILITTTPPTGG